MTIIDGEGDGEEGLIYSNSFKSLHPRQAHNVLLNRLRQARNLNEELIEHFRERITIEEHYSRTLLKLSKKTQSNPSPESTRFKYDQDQQQPYDRAEQDSHELVRKILQQELIKSIDSHSSFQTQLQNEVEGQLRKSFDHHLTQLRTTDEQLAKLVKNYEEAEQRLNRSNLRLNSTNSNSRKIQSLQTKQYEDQQIFNQAKQLWIDQSTQAFKSYQAIDQQRLLELFETLTKFETLQSDHYRQQMEISEKSTMSLLAFDLKQDIQRFALINGHLISDPPPPTPTNHTNPIHPPSHSTPTPGHSRQPTAQTHSRQPTAEAHSRQPTLEPHSRQPTLELHSRQPTLELHSRQPTLELHSRQPSLCLSEANGADEGQLRSSTRSPSLRPSAFTTPSQPLAASLSSSSAGPRTNGPAYDPNHPEIPKLNAPNISVPIRSTPTSPAHNPSNGLPPRTLYVQPHPSSESVSVLNRSGPSIDLARSQRSNMRAMPSSKPTPSGPSITEKLFSRARLTNMLSRNTSNNTNAGSPPSLKQPQGRRMSQTNLSASQLNDPITLTTPTDRSRQRRSSSMMGRDSSGRISPAPPTAPETTAANQKPAWSSSRLGQLTGPLLKKKFSQSGRHWTPSSANKDQPRSAKSSSQPPKVDSEGFSIPPAHRDRPPWETDTDTEVLSLDRTESSSHQHPNSSRTNAHEQVDLPDRAGNTTPGAAGKHQFAIKPSMSQELTQPLDEAARLAAIQRVQNTLASSSTGPSTGLVSGTRRSNAALRGRRADGRGQTMYDASPVPATPTATPLVRRGTVSERPDPIAAPLQNLSSTASFDRSLSDHTGQTPRTAPSSFSHLYSSPEPLPISLSNPPSATFPIPSLPQQNQCQESRSNSLSSAISNSNPGSHGLFNLGPAYPTPGVVRDPAPHSGPSSSKNPFLNMSISSAFLPNVSSQQEGPGAANPAEPPHSHGVLLSVTEKLNVLMHQGTVSKLLIIGEVCIPQIALSGILDRQSKKGGFSFKIEGLDRLEKVVYPLDLIVPVSTQEVADGEGKTGEYRLDLDRLRSLSSPSPISHDLCLLKYRLLIDHSSSPLLRENASRHVPMIITPRWRCVDEKTELVINYRQSPAFRLFHTHHLSNPASYTDICLLDTHIKTAVYSNSFGHSVLKSVSNVQCLPSAQFDQNMNQVQWSLSGPTLQVDVSEELGDGSRRQGDGGVKLDGLEGKLICRFIHPPPSSSSSSSSSHHHDDDDDEKDEASEDLKSTDNNHKDSTKDEKMEKKKLTTTTTAMKKSVKSARELEESCGPIHVSWSIPNISLSGTRISFVDKLDINDHLTSETQLDDDPSTHRIQQIRFNSFCSTFLAR